MRDYFKRLKDHPGNHVALMMTLLGFVARATNRSFEWWQGGLFGMLFLGFFSWSAVLISNFKRRK